MYTRDVTEYGLDKKSLVLSLCNIPLDVCMYIYVCMHVCTQIYRLKRQPIIWLACANVL